MACSRACFVHRTDCKRANGLVTRPHCMLGVLTRLASSYSGRALLGLRPGPVAGAKCVPPRQAWRLLTIRMVRTGPQVDIMYSRFVQFE